MQKLLMVAAGLFLAGCGGAMAQTLTVTDGTQTVELTAEQLAELPQTSIETSTAWTEGEHTFSGPSFADLLTEAGLPGETINVEALDGYSIDVPRGNLTGDGAILAMKMDDQPLPEGKAPYWVIFPYDRSPEMNDEDHQSWSVWTVSKLTVK